MLKDISITKVQKSGAKAILEIKDYAVITRGEEELGLILNKTLGEYLIQEGVLDQILEELYELDQKSIVKAVRKARERRFSKETLEFNMDLYLP